MNPGGTAARTFWKRPQPSPRGQGVDAVIITAATDSNEPVSQAAQMCRKRGRIVLVGVVGLNLSRDEFYEKELTFQVSCSYGPGRYDSAYEEGGHDYPIGFVRWTEQRNFEAVLELMASGQLDVKPLISHRFTGRAGCRGDGAADIKTLHLWEYSSATQLAAEGVEPHLERTIELNAAPSRRPARAPLPSSEPATTPAAY